MISPYPYVIENFFDETEYKTIKNYMHSLMREREYVFINDVSKLEGRDKWIINHYVGRINITIDKEYFPEELTAIISKHSKDLNPNSEFSFIEFVRYSKAFGYPRIDPHIDPPSKQTFMFNVQIDANIKWPLVEYIDDLPVETVLNNNECAVMNVDRIVHWRKPMYFNDGDYVDMAFIHFNDENIEPVPKEWYPHPPSWKEDRAFIHSIRYTKNMVREYPAIKDGTMDDLALEVKDRVNSIGIESILNL
jgi:hypothetical protein